MRRVFVIAAALFSAVSLWGQGRNDVVGSLMWRNRELQARVDSLERIVKELKGDDDVFGSWENLEDIDWESDGFGGFIEGRREQYSSEDAFLFDRIKQIFPSFKITWNPVLKKYIDYYTNGRHKKSLPVILSRYDHYIPYFKKVFARYGIPQDVIALSIVESAVTVKAKSKVGALGMWQFMPGTARGYGLRVDELVDERMDWRKETAAAAQYLLNAYKRYGRWDLAVSSYNCGAGSVNRALVKASGKTGFWDVYPFLPEETRGYLPSLVAAGYVVEYYQDYNIYKGDVRFIDEAGIVVAKNSSFIGLCSKMALSRESLTRENPHILTDVIPQGVTLYVPREYEEIIKNLIEQ